MASSSRTLIARIMGKRRTWVCLFLLAYAILLSSCWTVLLSIRSWHSAAASVGWPALYASLLYGAVFGLLSMAAALAVAVPATLVSSITVLVLLSFAGKPRRSLVTEGRRIASDVAAVAIKILVREGNLVAAVSAGLSFFALLLSRSAAGGDRGFRDLTK